MLKMFRLSRTSFQMTIGSLFVLIGVLTVEWVKYQLEWQTLSTLELAFLPLVTMGTALAASLGTLRISELGRNKWLAIAVGGGLLLCAVLLNRENMFSYRSALGFADRTDLASRFWWGSLLLTVAAWGGTRIAFWLDGKCGQEKMTRPRLLIGLGIVMFVAMTINNIVQEANLSVGLNGISGFSILVLSFFGVVFSVVLPTWLIRRVGGWLGTLSGFIVICAIAGSVSVAVGLNEGTIVAMFGLGFTVIVSILTGQMERSTVPPNPKKPIFGYLAILMTGVFLVAAWNLDLLVLWKWEGPGRLRLARVIKQMTTDPGVIAEYQVHWEPIAGGFKNLQVEFLSHADPQYLAPLENDAYPHSVWLKGLTPTIETRYLNGLSLRSLSISDSEVTSKQLNDLASSTGQIILDNCHYVPSKDADDQGLSLPGVAHLSWTNMPEGAIGSFLERLDPAFGGTLYLWESDLSDDDWKQVVDASRQIPIFINETPTPAIIEYAKLFEGAEGPCLLTVRADFNENRQLHWRLLLDTKIRNSLLPFEFDDDQSFWDLAFASRSTGAFSSVSLRDAVERVPRIDLPFEQLAEQFHWVYRSNPAGEPVGLLIPFGSEMLSEVVKMTELETLSVDGYWLPALRDSQQLGEIESQDIAGLGALKKLKRLDLSFGLWPADMSFLKKLTKLEHLQFSVVADGAKKLGFGFSAADCPQLKSLVLFGSPSKLLVAELVKLPRIQSLTIVDVNGEMQATGKKERLAKVLGERIQLVIVPLEEFQPSLPEAFNQHLLDLRPVIREKYLGTSE